MKPSLQKRESALKWSSFTRIKKLWIKVSAIVLPILILIELILPVPFNVKLLVILFTLVFFGILIGLAFGIMSAIVKGISKGVETYEPVLENRVDFHTLCQEALKISENSPWLVEPHEAEGWIDVTWKWKDSVDLNGLGVDKNEELFYKMFKVYSDYTYEDLDMVISKNAMLSLLNGGMSVNFYIGHVQNKQYRINIGIDSERGAGIHTYAFDTLQLTNYMHKWFAAHGYKYRGM